ncbi:hypothetical protein BGW80DRAFT_759596 [Lactifluus volemus]|nr:hypothetical protein BGW80DRAFT_759596 [Lactifluus volemus]
MFATSYISPTMTRTDSRVDVSERPWKVVLKADEPLDYSVTSKYLKIVEEEDKHKFESVADTADKTIVFVSSYVICSPFYVTYQL